MEKVVQVDWEGLVHPDLLPMRWSHLFGQFGSAVKVYSVV